MNDQMVPADLAKRLHELVGKWETSASLVIENDVGATLDQCADELRDLLPPPPPPRPTMADMTASERNEHMWMQCEVEGIANLAVIVDPFWTKHTARVMWDDGVTNEEAADTVTPRPDLPRMTWPGDEYIETDEEGDTDD